jgi:hypothetical protein
MDVIGIIGIVLAVVSLSFAIWQYQRANQAEKNLQLALKSLPTELLNNVSRFLERPTSDIRELYDLQESERTLHTSYADLDGNGEDELLVQYPYGAHSAVLQVFGFRNRDFKLIDEISIDTMAGFLPKDVDGDGRLEIVTHEVSRDADFPYVMGFRDEVWYRLENGHFVEVKRSHCYTDEALNEARRDHASWLSVNK